MCVSMNALKQYIDLYDESRQLIEMQSPALLNTLRRDAREHLQDARLPRKGSEDYEATDLLTGEKQAVTLKADQGVKMTVPAYGARVWKINS